MPIDDMPEEIDFSKGERGKFHGASARPGAPIHLDSRVQDALIAMADVKGVDLSDLVNDLLRKSIELIALGKAVNRPKVD